jgi:hypothetical protein
MADENSLDEAVEKVTQLSRKYLEKAAEVHLRPYLGQISEGLQRCMKLTEAAGRADKETAEEILRAVVVLNHAYLEDFLRRVALWLMPLAGEAALNTVPLVGASGRVEKFQLGKLAEHRGKKIDVLIRESVAAHMERSTFNSVTEIMSFLESVNVKLPSREEIESSSIKIPRLPIAGNTLSLLEAMMKRRHHIVHRADKAKAGGGLQQITEGEVGCWLAATMLFTLSIATENFLQRHSQAQFLKELEEFSKVWEGREASRQRGTPSKANRGKQR